MIRFDQVKTLEYPHKKRAGVKKLPLAAFALGALILGACSTAGDVAQVFNRSATNDAADTVETAAATDTIAGDRPAMWEVVDEDSNITLFGTFHLLPDDAEWSSDVLVQTMAASPTTWLEADATSPQATQALQAAVQELAPNPPGVTLSSLLGPERAARLAQTATSLGIPMSQLEPLRPWFVSLQLTVVGYQQAGLNPQSGADLALLEIAKTQGDEIGYLEDGVDQLRRIASLDDTGDFTGFDEGLEQIENIRELSDRWFSAWINGDVQTLEDEVVTSVRSSSEYAFQVIFAERNANWFAQVEQMMAGEGNHFIAVGVGHLIGEDSLVDMLEDKGYTVRRIQ